MKGLDALLNRFLGGPMLLVFLHKTLHELRVDGTFLEHIIGKLGGIDPLELFGGTLVHTHDLVEADPVGHLPLFHA